MCNCLYEYNKWIKSDSGDPSAEIETTSEIVDGRNVFYPAIYARYKQPKLRDGKLGVRRRHPLIVPFCCFCGELYDNALIEEDECYEEGSGI